MSLWPAALADPEVFKKTNKQKQTKRPSPEASYLALCFQLTSSCSVSGSVHCYSLPLLLWKVAYLVSSPRCQDRFDLNTDPNPRFWFSTAAPGVLVPQSVRVFTLDGICCFC